jgi:PmbA protein
LGYIGAEKAEKMLDAQFAPSKKLPILLDERAVKQSIGAIIGFGVNGFQVMTGTSYFTDKIGAEIAVSELEVWDDPHVDHGTSSKPYDAEGTPTTKVDLVTNGILESYVTDSYTSNKLGLVNTGNAGAGFRSKVPRPRTHQLQIKEGTDGKSAMLEDMKEGILVESGFGPAGGSPNISAQINRGFYVKDGEVQYPLKNSMLGSDVFELLSGIQGISKELLVEFGQQSPMILFGEVSIAGAGQKKQGGPAVTMSSF